MNRRLFCILVSTAFAAQRSGRRDETPSSQENEEGNSLPVTDANGLGFYRVGLGPWQKVKRKTSKLDWETTRQKLKALLFHASDASAKKTREAGGRWVTGLCGEHDRKSIEVNGKYMNRDKCARSCDEYRGVTNIEYEHDEYSNTPRCRCIYAKRVSNANPVAIEGLEQLCFETTRNTDKKT